jgi:hypothetical protein
MSYSADIHLYIAIFHVLVIVPFFIYVGISREKIPQWVYYLLGALALQVFVFHFYKFYGRADYASGWVNLIHILLVAPLLATIAYYGNQTARRFYEMLLILAFGALGYHSLNIYRHFA